MRNLTIALLLLAFLTAPALAASDYVQYDLDKLAKKSDARLKEINKMIEDAKRK